MDSRARQFFRTLLHKLIAYVRWDAQLNRHARDKDGTSLGTERAHLEAAARQGSASARKALEGPPFPEPLGYLVDWLHELHGRSGVGEHGVNVLTYATIRDWAGLTHRVVRPMEVSALIALDAVLCHPGESD